MNIQRLFAQHLIQNKGYIACHEVTHYCHNADVLAVDKNKKLVLEYEFKNNSQDLKVAEFKKEKYKLAVTNYRNEMFKSFKRGKVKKPWKMPHFFYFVVTEALWEKEQLFLRELKVGTIIYREVSNSRDAHIGNYQFYVAKRTVCNKNPQSYDVALKNIAKRLSNVYGYEPIRRKKHVEKIKGCIV